MTPELWTGHGGGLGGNIGMMRTILVLALGLLTLVAPSCGGGGGGSGNSSGTTTQITLTAIGSAPKGASVAYGTDAANYTGHFPLHKTLPVFPRTGYYYISAQLKNGGNITCKLTIGNASSVGHARSGHKTCYAKLTNGYGSGWH